MLDKDDAKLVEQLTAILRAAPSLMRVLAVTRELDLPDWLIMSGAVYQRVEIERGYFRRVIELGADVHPEQASARYEDGMLRVELPLVQRISGAQALPVKSTEP